MYDVEFDTSGFDAICDRMISQAEGGYGEAGLRAAGMITVETYIQEEKARFISASHNDGTWAPLSEKRKDIRAAMESPNSPKEVRRGAKGAAYRMKKAVASVEFPILYVTGALYNSLDRGSTGNITNVSYGEITYGTNIPYAKELHEGNPSTNLPARPILDDASDNVIAVASKEHAAAVEAAGSL